MNELMNPFGQGTERTEFRQDQDFDRFPGADQVMVIW